MRFISILLLLSALLFSLHTPAAEIAPSTWDWSGDLRYRLAKSKEDIDETRTYQQLRARIGFKATVNDEVQGQVRLATGTSAISTNQTLGDAKEPGMARRNFGLDLAFIDWKPESSTHLWAGRTANPFWAPAKNQMIFDSDLAFEGLAIKWDPRFDEDRGQVFLNAGGFMISENYAAPEDLVDTGLAGAQLGVSYKGGFGTVAVHAAAYHWINIQDRNITSLDKDAKTDGTSFEPDVRYKGNRIYANDPSLLVDARKYLLRNKFVVSNYGIEWKTSTGPFEWTFYYDGSSNQESSDLNQARETGAILKWGRSQVSYASITKEADSTLSAFTDSDANGGGTDNEGTRIGFAYQLSNRSSFAFTEFKARRAKTYQGVLPREYSATQIDFLVNF